MGGSGFEDGMGGRESQVDLVGRQVRWRGIAHGGWWVGWWVGGFWVGWCVWRMVVWRRLILAAVVWQVSNRYDDIFLCKKASASLRHIHWNSSLARTSEIQPFRKRA